LLQRGSLERMLHFSCAAAALNCTAMGARGGIRSPAEILKRMDDAERHPALFKSDELRRAAKS
jgi:sulfofructose kinase